MARAEGREIFFRQFEQSHRWSQPPAMLGMGRMLEILLQMNERSRGLDQSLEKVVVAGVAVEPKVLQHVMSFVVALIVPAAKVSAIERIHRDFAGKSRSLALQVTDELRNSFAFVHEALNFNMPQMMGKLTFPEGDNIQRRSQE